MELSIFDSRLTQIFLSSKAPRLSLSPASLIVSVYQEFFRQRRSDRDMRPTNYGVDE